LTGRENIFLNGAILGMSHREIKQKFDEIVAFSEVEKFLDTPVKRFSSGMITRLGFAIAAHLDPDLLIVDEVLAVGDAQFQQKCLKKMNELGSHGRTVLFVSHDVGSILTLCNKGIYLEKGRLKAWGPVDESINAYLRTANMRALAWEGNEGDEHIRFYKASLAADSPLKEFFFQGESTNLEIEYEVLQSNLDLIVGFGIWNHRHQLLGRSHTSDDVDNFQQFTHKGRHKLSFKLDAGLFHEGEYLIKVDCFIHNKKRVLNDEILLKFPIYSPKKNTRFSHMHEKEGIFLGNRWERLAASEPAKVS
jgi:lipopolysaccharide transport system ATP-binding protein